MPTDLMPAGDITSTPTDSIENPSLANNARGFIGPLFSQISISDAEIFPSELALYILDFFDNDARKSLAATSTGSRRTIEYAKFIALKEQLEKLPVISLAEYLLYADELNDTLLTDYCREILGEEIVLSHSILETDEQTTTTTNENMLETSGLVSLEMYFRETQDLMRSHLRNPEEISLLFYGNGTLGSEQEVRVIDGDNAEEFWESLLKKAELACTHLALFDTPDPSADYTSLNDFLRHARAFERFLADVKLMWEISKLAYQRVAMHQPLDGFFSCVPGDRWLTSQQQFMEAAKPILEDEVLMARISSRLLLALADFGVADYLLAAFMQHPQLNQLTPAEIDFLIEQEVFPSFLQQCVKDNTPGIDVFIERNLSKNQLLHLFNIHHQNARLLQSPAAVNKLSDDELVEIITTKLSFLGYFKEAIQKNEVLVARMAPEICLAVIKETPNYKRFIFSEMKLMSQFSNPQLFTALMRTHGENFIIFAQNCGDFISRLMQAQFLALIRKYSRLDGEDYQKSLIFIQFHFLKKFSLEHLGNELKSLKSADWLENEATRTKAQDAYQAYLEAKKKEAVDEAKKKAEDSEKTLAMLQLDCLRFAPHLLRTDPDLQPLEKSEVGLENKEIRAKVDKAYQAYLEAKRQQEVDRLERLKKAAEHDKKPLVSESSDLSHQQPEQVAALSSTPSLNRGATSQIAPPQEQPEPAVSPSVLLADQIEASPTFDAPQEPPQDQKSLGFEEQSHEVSVNKQAPAMLQNQLSLEASQVIVPSQEFFASLSNQEQPRAVFANEETFVPIPLLTAPQNYSSPKPSSQQEKSAELVATSMAITPVVPDSKETAASALSLSLVEEEEQARKTNSYQAFSSARIQPQPSYVSLSSLMRSTYGREELRSTNERNIETYPPPNMTRESMAPQDSSTKNLPTVTSASVTGWRWLFRGILGTGGGYLVAGGVAALIKGSALLGISVAAAPAALALGGLLLLAVGVDIIYRAAISESASQTSTTDKATEYSPSFRPSSAHTPAYAPNPGQQVVHTRPSASFRRQ
jgi:hypothetical protein